MTSVFLCESCERAARGGHVPMLFGFVRVVRRGEPGARSEFAKACQHERWSADRMRHYGAAETIDEIAAHLRAAMRATAKGRRPDGADGSEADGSEEVDLSGELRARGYWRCGGVFELTVFGSGSVRVTQDGECTVGVFDAAGAPRWSARFTRGAPDSAVVAMMDAAEAELASGSVDTANS